MENGQISADTAGQPPAQEIELLDSDGAPQRSTGRRTRPSAHRLRNRIVAAVCIVLVVVLGCGVWFGLSAKAAVDEVGTMSGLASHLGDELKSGNSEAAVQTANSIADSAASMRNNLNSPVWSLARFVPVYGEDVGTIQTLADVAEDMTANALVPVTQELSKSKLKDLTREDGSINLKTLKKILAALEEAAPATARSTEQINQLGEPHIAELKEPLATLKSLVGLLNSATKMAPQLSKAVPSFLGADGKRTYLVLAQTNAEIRSVGGMSGAYGKLTFDNGKMDMGDFGGFTQFVGGLADPDAQKKMAVNITSQEEQLFGLRMGCEPRDTNYNPDFARDAEIISQNARKVGFGKVDGVIALDPILFQGILKAIGPVTTESGITVDGDNATRILLRDSYSMMPANQTDGFFAEVAGAAMKRVSEDLSSDSILGLVSAFVSGLKQEHMLMWSKHDAEQAAFVELGFSGGLSHDETNPIAGVYYAAGGATKLSWYLNSDVSATKTADNPDGSSVYSVSVTVKNMLSVSEAATIPDYVNGSGSWQKQRGDMPLWVFLFAPAGGKISDLEANASFPKQSEKKWNPFYARLNDEGMAEAEYEGLKLWYGMIRISPGQTASLTYKVTTSPLAKNQMQIRKTVPAYAFLNSEQ